MRVQALRDMIVEWLWHESIISLLRANIDCDKIMRNGVSKLNFCTTSHLISETRVALMSEELMLLRILALMPL
jgi:hypothetical protein